MNLKYSFTTPSWSFLHKFIYEICDKAWNPLSTILYGTSISLKQIFQPRELPPLSRAQSYIETPWQKWQQESHGIAGIHCDHSPLHYWFGSYNCEMSSHSHRNSPDHKVNFFSMNPKIVNRSNFFGISNSQRDIRSSSHNSKILMIALEVEGKLLNRRAHWNLILSHNSPNILRNNTRKKSINFTKYNQWYTNNSIFRYCQEKIHYTDEGVLE